LIKLSPWKRKKEPGGIRKESGVYGEKGHFTKIDQKFKALGRIGQDLQLRKKQESDEVSA